MRSNAKPASHRGDFAPAGFDRRSPATFSPACRSAGKERPPAPGCTTAPAPSCSSASRSCPEYYLARTEVLILRQCAGEIAALAGRRACVVELSAAAFPEPQTPLLLLGARRSGRLRAGGHLR